MFKVHDLLGLLVAIVEGLADARVHVLQLRFILSDDLLIVGLLLPLVELDARVLLLKQAELLLQLGIFLRELLLNFFECLAFLLKLLLPHVFLLADAVELLRAFLMQLLLDALYL